MFNSSKKKVSELDLARAEVEKSRIEMAKMQGRVNSMQIERDFWVEQGRSLQNQVQQWQRMYSGLFDQLGKGVVTDQSIADNLAMAAEELRQPITTVEAIRALTASMQESTQGKYTSVSQRSSDQQIASESSAQQRKLKRG